MQPNQILGKNHKLLLHKILVRPGFEPGWSHKYGARLPNRSILSRVWVLFQHPPQKPTLPLGTRPAKGSITEHLSVALSAEASTGPITFVAFKSGQTRI